MASGFGKLGLSACVLLLFCSPVFTSYFWFNKRPEVLLQRYGKAMKQNSQNEHITYENLATRQRPRYLNIGPFDPLLQQLDTELLFPDPSLFKTDNIVKPQNSNYILMNMMASNVQHQRRKPLPLSLPAWRYHPTNVQYKGETTTTTPIPLPVSVNFKINEQKSNTCCNGNGQWRPFDPKDEIGSSSETEPVSLYLRDHQNDVISDDHDSVYQDPKGNASPSLASLLIPIPRLPPNDSNSIHNGTVTTIMDTANGTIVTLKPMVTVGVTSVSPLMTNAPQSDVITNAIITSTTPSQQEVMTTRKPESSSIKPASQPAAAAAAAAAADEKPKTKPKPETSKPEKAKPETSKPAVVSAASETKPEQSPPSKPEIQPQQSPPSKPEILPEQSQPSRPASTVSDNVLNEQFVPAEPPEQLTNPSQFEQPEISMDPIVSSPEEPLFGVPGDLPLFEDGGVAADAGGAAADEAAGGGESALPDLFGEFLNQVADMIEEFGPSSEVPLADEALGQSDGSLGGASDIGSLGGGPDGGSLGGGTDVGSLGGGPDVGSSSAGAESVNAGSAVESFDDGGQDGGDFGASDFNVGESLGQFDNEPASQAIQSNIDGDTPLNEGLVGGDVPLANNQDPVSVPSDVGGSLEGASSSSSSQENPTGSETALTSQTGSDAITSVQQSPPEPNYSEDYLPAIASEPQIHPPIMTDYIDPGMLYPYGGSSYGIPHMGASLSAEYAQQQQQPEVPDILQGEFHHREQSPIINVSESYGNNGLGVASGDDHSNSAGGYGGFESAEDETSLAIIVNYNQSAYGYEDNYDNGTNADVPLLLEHGGEVVEPVANHLEVHVSQTVWTPSSTQSSDPLPVVTTSATPVVYVTNPGYHGTSSTSGNQVLLETKNPIASQRTPNQSYIVTSTESTTLTSGGNYYRRDWNDKLTDKSMIYMNVDSSNHANNVDDQGLIPESSASASSFSSVLNENSGKTDAEGVPSDLISEVQANINMDLLRTDGLATTAAQSKSYKQ